MINFKYNLAIFKYPQNNWGLEFLKSQRLCFSQSPHMGQLKLTKMDDGGKMALLLSSSLFSFSTPLLYLYIKRVKLFGGKKNMRTREAFLQKEMKMILSQTKVVISRTGKKLRTKDNLKQTQKLEGLQERTQRKEFLYMMKLAKVEIKLSK